MTPEELIHHEARKEREDSDRYYGRLPRHGQKWRPNSDHPLYDVVWVIRKSKNHHQYHLDSVATCSTRHDGMVCPAIWNGIGEPAIPTLMLCAPGTPPAKAVRELIAWTRTSRMAHRDFAVSAAQCDRFA